VINQQAIHRFAQSTIRWTNVIGIVLTALLLMALSVPAGATKIERVVSPAGIEFWFVRDSTVPLVSIEFAFRGGSAQDPDDKGGLAEMTVAPAISTAPPFTGGWSARRSSCKSGRAANTCAAHCGR
jgi:hypothetical protein